jgi:hypothetical protein
MTTTYHLKSLVLSALKKICQLFLLSTCLLNALPIKAQDNPLGQTFQINTRLQSYYGKPAWLIIINDIDTGTVTPYFYPIYETENFWFSFTFAHRYRVSISDLQFGPPDAVIHNFCHLRNTVFNQESIVINLTGNLTPDKRTSECHMQRYKEYTFPIAEPTEDTSSNPISDKTAAAASAPAASPLSSIGAIAQQLSL